MPPPDNLTVQGLTEQRWNDVIRPYPASGNLYVYHIKRRVIGLNWSPNEMISWTGLMKPARKAGAKFTGRYWEFPGGADEFLKQKRKQFPELKIVRCNADIQDYTYALTDLGDKQMLVVSLPVPGGLSNPTDPILDRQMEKATTIVSREEHKVLRTSEGDWIAITRTEHVHEVLAWLQKHGAKDVSGRFTFRTDTKVNIQIIGWSVLVKCDLLNPSHYVLQPQQKYEWDSHGGQFTKIFLPWSGDIYTTRKGWPELERRLVDAGLAWEGGDPAAPFSVRISGNFDLVPGWTTPAPNGYTLHPYQREGIEFCLNRGVRALIGDEMGIGKTAQAIGVAAAIKAKKILVVCPANARYVWEREITGWTGNQSIQHLTTTLADLVDATWQIVTDDLLVARPTVWTLNDRDEKKAIEAVVGSLKIPKHQSYPVKTRITGHFEQIPELTCEKKRTKWIHAMRRQKNELLTNLIKRDHDLLIIDEAHRIKNEEAKRSISLREMAESIPHVLMLTGTPMRNNAGEATVLLGYLNAKASDVMSKENGYTLKDLQDCLEYYMIRRLKIQVLPQLPEKIRQVLEIDDLDSLDLLNYVDDMGNASRAYEEALDAGKSHEEAKNQMLGWVEKARIWLGLAKIDGSQVVETITDVIEAKESVVVFCAHHACSDALKQKLIDQGYTAEIVDGRTPQAKRAVIEREFQAKRLQCFIGGINSAGESITLTAADTVIFIELDWVPAALRQAEDRIHRVGQERGCHIIHLLAHGDNLDKAMGRVLLSKLSGINEALRERDEIFEQKAQSELRDTRSRVLDFVLGSKFPSEKGSPA